MPLQSYRDSGLFININFLEATSKAGISGYRGELVIVEGEIADDQGRRRPPLDVLQDAVLLADETKLKFMLGTLSKLQSLPTLVEKYQGDFGEDFKALLYVVNLKEPVQVTIADRPFVLIPLTSGLAFNEGAEELSIEKSDLKGMSGADKIAVLYDEMQTYKPRYPKVELEQALADTTDQVRQAWGAV